MAAQRYSVNWWRQWFASRNGTATVAEIERELGGGIPFFDPLNLKDAEHPNPRGINPAAKNLFFAGDFFPAASDWSSVTLGGPNSATAADLVARYSRVEDDTYNPAADRPAGWRKLTQGLASIEPILEPNPNGGFRTVGYTGGYDIIVGEIPYSPTVSTRYLFRGTGLLPVGSSGATNVPNAGLLGAPTETLAQLCARLVQPYADRARAFEAAYPGRYDDDEIAPGITYLGALYSVYADANRDPEIQRNNCPVPYPEAVGYSHVPSQNNPPPRPGRGRALSTGGTGTTDGAPSGDPNIPPSLTTDIPPSGTGTPAGWVDGDPIPGTTSVGSSTLPGPGTSAPSSGDGPSVFVGGTAPELFTPQPVAPITPVAVAPITLLEAARKHWPWLAAAALAWLTLRKRG